VKQLLDSTPTGITIWQEGDTGNLLARSSCCADSIQWVNARDGWSCRSCGTYLNERQQPSSTYTRLSSIFYVNLIGEDLLWYQPDEWVSIWTGYAIGDVKVSVVEL
jgi:hypothetical protein